jgi:hypothetical protein
MDQRTPIITLADLATLDSVEVVEGYHDGRAGFPCGDNRSRSYWHGWRNGRADAGLSEIDAAQRALVREFLAAKMPPETGPWGRA